MGVRRTYRGEGVSFRAPEGGDQAAILEALAARDRRDTGDPGYTRDFVEGWWRSAEFVPARDAFLAEVEGALAGYATVFPYGELVFVHPDYEGRGIGTTLLRWAEARAAGRGGVYRQRVPEGNTRAAALLEAAGYAPVRTVWQMARPLTGLPAAPALAPSLRLRRLEPEADARAVHAAGEAAFARSADFAPETFETFYAEHLATPQLDRSASLVARRDGAIAGFTVCRRQPRAVGYVDLLAVTPSERRLGLGTALLIAAFRAFAASGLGEARLEVSSANVPALRLYERLGMQPRLGGVVWEKAPG